MSIENFLNDFEKQKQEAEERKKQILEAKEKEIEKDKIFLENYANYYNESLKPEFENIGRKLDGKFALKFDESPSISQGKHYFSKIIITPKFDHYVKKIIISLTAESGRELITLTGQYENEKGDQHGDGIFGVQESIPNFKKLNIEDQISKILEKIFIKKVG